MRRALLSSLLLALATQPTVVRAQAAPDTSCSYSRCALRIKHGFLSTRLVRGTAEESVARLGWFGRGVDVLLAASDSAAYHARQYRSRLTTANVVGLVGAALLLVGAARGEGIGDGGPWILAGLTLSLVELPFQLTSRGSLDRAVWWYNRDLPRP